jgi:spore maturation protein CgeB
VSIRVLYLGMYWDYGDESRGRSFEELSFHAGLRAHPGIEVTHFDHIALEKSMGHDEMNRHLLEVATAGGFDALFCVLFTDQLDPDVLHRISEAGVVTIAWGCDDHWRFDNYSSHWAPHFDWWVTTAHSAVGKFKRLGINNVIKSQWAVEPSVYYPVVVNKDIEVSFIGQPHGIRPQFIQWLRSAGVPVAVYGYGWAGLDSRLTHEEMLELMSRSKLCLNLSNSSQIGEQQIKGRVFEVPACRSVLLTDMADDLGAYYEIGKEIVVYESPEDLLEKIVYFVAHHAERDAIADAGYARTLREHTWGHRFDAIFKEAGLT